MRSVTRDECQWLSDTSNQNTHCSHNAHSSRADEKTLYLHPFPYFYLPPDWLQTRKRGAGHRDSHHIGQQHPGANRYTNTDTHANSYSYFHSNAYQHAVPHGNEYANGDTNTKTANRRRVSGFSPDLGRFTQWLDYGSRRERRGKRQ